MENQRDIAKLRRWCIRKRGEGASVSDICTATQTPRRTFYNWWNRYENGGFENLTDKSDRPNTIHSTPPEVVEAVTAIRRQTDWCPHRIAGHLRKNGVSICHMTVYRIQRQAGLNHGLTKPGVKRTYRRWQRMHPNSLWQCDLKLVPPKWLVGILDDYSRFVPGSEHFAEGTAENVIWLWDRAVHEFGKPKEALTDHGTQFWVFGRESQASTNTVNGLVSSTSWEASGSPQRRGRSNGGSAPTTRNITDSSSTGNLSSTTTSKGHTCR